ncbi:MAG: NAD(P)(+) transhydrogenase (Re/Si-specific) subunit beta, partial [Anaerolineaceae bacterium]|nr:NAD(P)(+) transhydrogenase (Re/Si-specific) subunit beta [Anaerolineaceae bacterium]
MNDISQFTMGISILEITYIIASVLFIIGLKMLSHPDTARKGNLWAAFGMAAAILGTIIFHKTKGEGGEFLGIGNVIWILAAMAVGTIIGWVVAKRVKMTAMPQLVSLFNGMGGGCAALISLMEFPKIMVIASAYPYGEVICIVLGAMIGTVSFAGSMIAFGKLNENIGDIRSKLMRPINLLILFILLVLVIYITFFPTYMADGVHLDMTLLFVLFGLAFLYGIMFVMPIGGADMPVVISLLNS